ncbi:MAG TPA: hypothetical protein VFJ82_14000 [Longimicrobium sp.]|nr:hypothetical protein [Longimicrobium sp.]
MRKLTLDCESLTVESFPTSGTAAGTLGTFGGHALQPTLKTVCDQSLLGTYPTCCPCTP